MHTRKRINIMSSANPMYWQEGVGDDDEGKTNEEKDSKNKVVVSSSKSWYLLVNSRRTATSKEIFICIEIIPAINMLSR